jgi:type I restriction enzyme S subunit
MTSLLKHFDLLAAAPGGAEELRKLILELAVRGRLVSQDPADESADILLERIRAEKERLVKEGKIKPGKPLPPIAEDEAPYALPKGWKWVRLGEIVQINPRNNISDDADVSFVPMASIPDMLFGLHGGEKKKWSEVKTGFTHFAENDISVAKITPCFENGKGCVFRNLIGGYGAGTTELHIIRIIGGLLLPEYVHVYLKSPSFLEKGISKMTGTAGQKRLPREYLETNPIPLPPLAEQERIVAKVKELTERLDRYAALDERRRAVRTAAREAALRTAAAGEAGAWKRLETRFDVLLDDPSGVKSLRRAVLELAVRGRLVPHNPADESADSLCERIRAEKARLVKEGKIKAGKPLPPIAAGEAPYELPKGWRWVRLGEVITKGPTNGLSVPPALSGIKCLTLSATTQGFFKPEKCKTVAAQISDCEDLVLEKNDFLIQRANSIDYVGIVAIVDYVPERLIYPDLMMRFRCDVLIQREYVHTALSSAHSRIYYKTNAMGTQGNMPKINQATVLKTRIPLPPLAEQERIVAKVKELMAACDRLEAALEAREETARRFAEAAVGVV